MPGIDHPQQPATPDLRPAAAPNIQLPGQDASPGQSTVPTQATVPMQATVQSQATVATQATVQVHTVATAMAVRLDGSQAGGVAATRAQADGVQAGGAQCSGTEAGRSQADEGQAASVQTAATKARATMFGASQAGASQAGASQAGASQAGANQAGANQAGGSQAGGTQAGTSVHTAALAGAALSVGGQPDFSQGVPLLDLQRQYATIQGELEAAVLRVLRSGQYVLGPDCRALEEELAAYTRCRHAVACASGSDALLLALMAIGIRPGDEVLLPSFTFFATAGSVARLGAVPVFVDIEPDSFGMDPVRAAEAVTPATRAVIPVHLYGQCAALEPILAIAAKYGLAVIEDAAQALGAQYQGRPAGSWGDVGCYSFYPTKNLGGAGDGGMLCTQRDDLAEKLQLLRVHGMRQRYYHEVVGINSRLDSLQAAVLRVKLAYLELWTSARERAAARYTSLLAPLEQQGLLRLPPVLPQRRHVWNQYVIRVPGGKRDALRRFLQEQKIGTEIYYPVPLHMQACFADLGYRRGSLPETERAAAEVLALPIFAEITEAEQQWVAGAIFKFFGVATQAIPRPKFLHRASERAAH